MDEAERTASSMYLENLLENLVIKGDNFKALSYLLFNGYKNKIDLVYIDPPFSTNSDFRMTNERTRTISNSKHGIIAYSDKLAGEEYIEFIRRRIVLIYELLSEKGSFYMHIDSKIGHYIKIVLDEIFGGDNFINDIARRKSNPKNFARKAYGNQRDVVLFYAKNRGKHIWNDIRINFCEDELAERYKKKDPFGRRYTTVPIHAPGETNDGATGGVWKGMLPPEGRHWRCSPEDLDKLEKKGLIEWSKSGNPRWIKYADENKGKKIQDIWLDYLDPVYPDYPTQKNLKMLEMIVKQSSNPESIVLDAFAGSGNTLIAARNNGRKYIAIDKSEKSIEIIENKIKKDKKNERVSYFQL
ncbi:MAG: site-specific DNA-methyltransferase [Oscillospiraceae bacterium]